MFEYDKHYRLCQQLNKPFIKAKINPIHKNYFVQMDLMTCDYDLSVQEQLEIKQLIQDEIKFVNSTLNYVFKGYNIDTELTWFDGVSSINVNDFCTNLYDLSQQHHN
jgi:hypothetical protein